MLGLALELGALELALKLKLELTLKLALVLVHELVLGFALLILWVRKFPPEHT